MFYVALKEITITKRSHFRFEAQFLPFSQVQSTSSGSFPEQRLVIKPTLFKWYFSEEHNSPFHMGVSYWAPYSPRAALLQPGVLSGWADEMLVGNYLQSIRKRSYHAKNPAILRYFFATERTQLNAAHAQLVKKLTLREPWLAFSEIRQPYFSRTIR